MTELYLIRHGSTEANLAKPPAPFATVAIQALEGVRERLRAMALSLRPATTLSEKELNDEPNAYEPNAYEPHARRYH